MREFSSSKSSGVFWREMGAGAWGGLEVVRGARRSRKYVCLRLPADSLKTERSIFGIGTTTSSCEEGEGEAAERRERE